MMYLEHDAMVLGMLYYYRDTWIRRSNFLAPLTHLDSAKFKWERTEAQQNEFEFIDQNINKQTLLPYPDLLNTLKNSY
jgi:hypothetical protein